jgi:hypothetical protein
LIVDRHLHILFELAPGTILSGCKIILIWYSMPSLSQV